MSTRDLSLTGGPITLDQLIALNDELAALVRSGVPLERGLIEAGRDLQGRLGSLANDLGERLGAGERLPEALAGSSRGMPELYRAMVEAGLRSGRLAMALENMATLARGYADTRRAVALAFVYPLLVLCLAYGLAVLFLVQMVPRFIAAFESLGLAPVAVLGWMGKLGDSAQYWVPIPVVLLLLMGLRWAWSGRSSSLDARPFGPIVGRFPMVGAMIAGFRAANFAEALAMLIDHRVPMDEAVRLSGAASGDRDLKRATEASPADLASLPPLLAWLLTAGRAQGDLARSLRDLARNYRRQAEARAEVLRSILPITVMLGLGAGTVLIYALMMFIPLTRLWDQLSIPVNS